jgi:hypothetical protein
VNARLISTVSLSRPQNSKGIVSKQGIISYPDLHAQYQLHPISPLITDPTICTHLSLAALKANLAAHAVFNPSISLSGTKSELIGRLREILERREGDRIVKEVVWGYEGEEAGVDVEEAEADEGCQWV